jgi:hypothetical protein
MSDIYLSITETPTVVTLSAPVVSGALAATVTVANVVSVNVVTMPAITVQAAAPSVTTVAGTVTIGSCVTHGVNVANSLTISSLPAISGTVTANLAQGINSSSLTSVDQTKAIAVQIFNEDGSIIGGNDSLKVYPAGLGLALAEYANNEGINYPLPISGTVTANGFHFNPDSHAVFAEVGYCGSLQDGENNTFGVDRDFPISGTVTVGNSITIGSCVTHGVNVANSVTISALPVSLSTTTIGGTARLNVTLSSATTIGATAPSYGNLYGGSDGTNIRAILVDSSGRTTVTGSVSILGTPSVTMGAISGTVTANVASTTVTISAQPSGALTTRFGSVVTANTAGITTAVTNTSRKYLLAQNISTGTVTIGIGFSPTTTQGIQLTAGAGLTFDSFVPTGAVYWLGATTGAAYTILEG